MPTELFALAEALRKRGEPFAVATVVRAERPTSGKPGDKAIVTCTGELLGWIGGSCAAPTVIRTALQVIEEDRARLVRLSAEPDAEAPREGVLDLPLTCYSGGTMEVFIEPHQPQPALLVVGGKPVARALVRLGAAIGYRVFQLSAEDDPAEGAEQVGSWEAASGLLGPLTWVVVASHSEGDEALVESALRDGAAWVGLVASPRRAGAIRAILAERGVPAETLDRLESPAGLDLGAREPEEIAVSIVARLVQLRRSVERLGWGVDGRAESRAEGVAIDPVCGMEVEIAGARHTHEHAGETYYFCCGGCLRAFASDPARHMASRR